MTALPGVVSREQRLEARLRLLEQEKELTRRGDALTAGRRLLPMVQVEKVRFVRDCRPSPLPG